MQSVHLLESCQLNVNYLNIEAHARQDSSDGIGRGCFPVFYHVCTEPEQIKEV